MISSSGIWGLWLFSISPRKVFKVRHCLHFPPHPFPARPNLVVLHNSMSRRCKTWGKDVLGRPHRPLLTRPSCLVAWPSRPRTENNLQLRDLNWPSEIFRQEPGPKQAGSRSPEPWQVKVAAYLVCERQKLDSDLSQARKTCLTRSLWNPNKKPAGKSRIGSRYGWGERGGEDEEAEDRQEDHCQGVEWAGFGKFL